MSEQTLEQKVEDLLHPSTIEVGGIKVETFTDRAGRVWAVPADDANVDPNEYGLRNILEIPEPEPEFYYEYVGSTRLNEVLSRGFVLVTPEEVGLKNPLTVAQRQANAAIGVPSVSHHQVGDLHLVKCLKVTEKRFRKAQKAIADAAIADINVPRHLGKPLADAGVQIHDRSSEKVMGQPIVTPAADFKEYPKED